MARRDSTSSPNASAPQPKLNVLAKLWPFLRPYRFQTFGAMVALSVAGLTVLTLVYGLKPVIDKGFAANDAAMLDKTLGYLLGAITLLAAATYARFTLITWLGERLVADLRRALYSHILALSPSYFESARSGDILSRLSADTTILQSLVTSVSTALRNSVLLTGGIILMLTTSLRLTVFVLIGIPVVVIPIVFLARKVRQISRANQDRQGDVSAAAEESIHGIRTVQAFGHENISRSRFNATVERAMSAAQRHIRLRGLLSASVVFLAFSAIGVVLWVGGHDVLNHTITGGQLSTFVGYSFIAAISTGAISDVIGDLQRAAGAADRIFDLLGVEPTIKAPLNPVSLPQAEGRLSLENVSFAYEAKADAPALKSISFAVEPGERVAIVGPSGAGKTTLFQLILRFYDPQTGVIRLDGVDIKTARPQEVRARIGIVPQDPVIFSTTARDNIAYGETDATDEQVRAAAKAAHADEFIAAMPEAYDTYLGEKGVRISGGQKQRIAIARAILRNPSLLLLDEATSALDAQSERYVQDALDKLMVGRTTLIIAHRLATVKSADRILVVDEGRVVASGTHQSLISAGGLYAQLAALQFDAREAPSLTVPTEIASEDRIDEAL